MYNDSVETVLLRHYGNTAPVPAQLEQRLLALARNEAAARREQARANERARAYRLSRRRAVKLVALGSAGLSVLSVGLEVVDSSLFGSQHPRTAFS